MTSRLKVSTSTMVKVAVFAALYFVSDFIPISPVIGGGGKFISLRIVLVPVIAYVLKPDESFILSLILTPFKHKFPPFSFIQPLLEIWVGSLLFHSTLAGGLIALTQLTLVSIDYLIYNYEFPWYPLLHLAAALTAIILSFYHERVSFKVKALMCCFVITMSSHGVILPFFIHVVPLSWETWAIILPVTLVERLISVVGSSIIIFAISRILPQFYRKE